MTTPPGDRCSYTFDPKAWKADTGTTSPLLQDLLDRGEVWQCPHEATEDHDRCLFHLPVKNKEPTAVREAFLARIENDGQRPKQFIGARFGEFTLDHAIVECGDNHMIDLRHAQFEGETSWWYTVVRQPISFEGALFRARPTFSETEFSNEVYLNDARFGASAQFHGAEFVEGVWGNDATFAEANFHRATFGGPVDFSESSFERAQFRESHFDDVARFTEATFESVSFTGSHFGDRFYLDGATLPQQVSVRHATISDLAAVEDVTLTAGSCAIDFGKSIVPAGRLYLPERGTLVYNLTDGTLGDVDLIEEDPPDDLFDHYRFLYTTFDGFDFGRYRDALHASTWRLHDIANVPGLEARAAPPTDGDLESTYLKAKNGANAIGDTKAAAEFFRQEMLYRREQYIPVVFDSSEGVRTRLAAAGRWSANTLLNITAGYGERPSRVIAVSVGTIVAFTFLFAAVRPSPPYGTSIGYLILSLESFITLVLGGADDVGGPWIRLLAQIEGFVGAFFIALFVFTLTRSIHR